MNQAKYLDVRNQTKPRAMCFAISRPANHAICCFIDSRGYASGPIRKCLLIDYIIKCNNDNETYNIMIYMYYYYYNEHIFRCRAGRETSLYIVTIYVWLRISLNC